MKPIVILFAAAFLIGSDAAAQKTQTLGHMKKASFRNNTLQIDTDAGKAMITVYNPDVFRIRITREQFGNDFSYAVVGQPEPTEIKKEETSTQIKITTATTVLEINKKPLRFTFKTPDGKVINQDDPQLGTIWNGTEVFTCKTLFDDEKFIGLGEKTGNLDRRGSSYWHWNTDNPHHDNNSEPLYASIPFYIGLHSGLMYGIYFDNTHKSYFNFGASQARFSSFGADDGDMDYYFINGKSVEEIVKHYTFLTGRMEMPPLWALGNQQCRWSYYPDDEVLRIATTFREKKIPADVIYLDIHYMDAYKVFTWHPERFANPEATLSRLRDMGFHTTVIIDPGIKVEKGYETYEDGLAKDMFIKYPDGVPYQGQVWPGWCHFADYTKPAAREWWGAKFDELVRQGIDGFWNDMNEIATWGQATPNFVQFDWDGKGATYRKAKNIYGMLMAKSTFEGTKKLLNGRRPLILTRAGFAGMQRYTAIWTGDNQANDDHMLLGIRLVNSIGLSGVAFTGYDIGGFGGDATPALYARWISLGALSPFCRTHSAFNTKDSEPWAYGEDVEDISRNYLNLRYRLMPYLYSLFREASLTGMPVQRTLALDYTHDPRTFYYAYQNQYTLGKALLIAPCKSTEMLTKVFLPDGQWYGLYDDKTYEGGKEYIVESPLNRLPVFVKGGSIVPVHPVRQHTGEDPGNTLEVHLFKGKGQHSFTYYEDDGLTYNHLDGRYYERTFDYNGDTGELTIRAKTGQAPSKFKDFKIILHGFDSKVSTTPAEYPDDKIYTRTGILPDGFDYKVNNLYKSMLLKDEEIKIKL